MDDIKGQLETSIQAKVEGDTEFQSSLEGLSDDERNQKIDERKSVLFNEELANLKKGSEEAKKAADLANNYKTRAEKAEAELKAKGATTQDTRGLSDEDLIYIAKADIHADDIGMVRDEARLRGVSVQEAHKFLGPILKEKAEERRTAAATQTRSPRGASQQGPDAILQRARQGTLPDADADVASLAQAEVESLAKRK